MFANPVQAPFCLLNLTLVSMKRIHRNAFTNLRRLVRFLLTFKILDQIEYPVIRLGSLYGGWNIAATTSLHGKVVISCGAGEDISFDIELASLFRVYVFIVDPTPRAIVHVQNTIARIGMPATKSYANSGNEDVTAYNLQTLNPSQLSLIPKALWNNNCNIKFYAPRNPEHVSHSILNIQENYSREGSCIEVDAIDFKALMHVCSIDQPPEILKLDIEGSEHEVLLNLLQSKQFPRQILVEYDELSKLSIRSLTRFHRTHNSLLSYGYKLFAKENLNYSYLFCP